MEYISYSNALLLSRTVVSSAHTEPLPLGAGHLDRVLRRSLLGSSAILAQKPARVIDNEDSNSANHRNGLKDPEEPLRAESITVHALGKLANSVNATDLSNKWSAFNSRHFIREAEPTMINKLDM